MDHTTPAPCVQSPNTAFIDPATATRRQLRKAHEMCDACPILQQCAEEALHSGTSLDGHRIKPADDVYQAGVHCQGNRDTATQLAAIAGVPVPDDYRDAPQRLIPQGECVNCGSPMVKWTRGEVPEGYVLHHARNFCSQCRVEYTHYISDKPKRFTKPIDRHRHHQVTTWQRPSQVARPEHPTLF